MFCVSLWIGGCRRPVSPQAAYQETLSRFQQADLNGALQDADRNLQRYRSRDLYWAWRFRILKAQILVYRGSNSQAFRLIEEDLPSQLAATDVAFRKKMVEALADQYSQQYEQAERNLHEASQLAAAQHLDMECEVTAAQGGLQLDEGKYPLAGVSLRKALALARAQNNMSVQGVVLTRLGLLATRQEHYDESVDWNRQALAFAQSAGLKTTVPYILGNMGWSYFSLGDFEKALQQYRQAEDAASQAGLLKNQIYWGMSVGNAYFALHDYAAAESAYQKNLSLARNTDDREAVTACLENLALVDLEKDQPDSAARYSAEAIQLLKNSQDKSVAPDSVVVQARIQFAHRDYAQAEKSFQSVRADPAASSSLHWEAQARLAEVFAAEGRPADADRQFRQSLQTIEKARSAVKTEDFRLSFLSGAIEFYDSYIDFLVATGKPDQALEVAELSRARSLADGLEAPGARLNLPIPGFAPTQIARRAGSVILSYWLGPRQSYLWAITPGRVTFFKLPPAAEIDPLVQSYGQSLLGPRDVLDSDNATGKKLYDLLVAPAANLISPNARVAILPDGSLYSLNFETLLVSAPRPHYWIEDATITDASSLLLLSDFAKPHSAAPKKLLLMGDAVSASPDFPALPQAAAEMEGVENYFPPRDRLVYSGPQATAAAYLASQPGQFSFIHFVAHGTASRLAPLDSAVILSSDGDSYKLYARDIMRQRLHADLVTISACQGQGARTFSGEGLVGLSWAFLHAGAHRVIAALWEVDDSSTPQLMHQLYGEINRGESPDVALRDAKLAMLHSSSAYRRPRYWAPFELYRGS
ncbi:MAG: CHAT domain-containing protein [Candidatus Acidiferrales bacterium]